jgi:hypothetical protein
MTSFRHFGKQAINQSINRFSICLIYIATEKTNTNDTVILGPLVPWKNCDASFDSNDFFGDQFVSSNTLCSICILFCMGVTYFSHSHCKWNSNWTAFWAKGLGHEYKETSRYTVHFFKPCLCSLQPISLKSNRNWRSEESKKKCSAKFLCFHGNWHCFGSWFVNGYRHNTVWSSNTCSWNAILWLNVLLFNWPK